jgi:putative sterol carrier protein
MGNEFLEYLQNKAITAAPLKAKVKFLIDQSVYFVNGTENNENVVSQEDLQADCTVTCKKEVFEQLITKKLSPAIGFMLGKIKLQGDISLAIKIQSFI